MKTQSVVILLTVMGLGLSTGCSPVEFKQLAGESIASSPSQPDPDIIVVPPPPPVPPVVVSPTVSKGACAADSSTKLLTCMNCLVPAIPAPQQFSKKGQALLDIMTAACQVTNKSDPAGYQPPPRAELLRRLNKLSPTLYPDSVMTAIQTSTIDQLLSNPAAMKDMWGGLWQSGVLPTTTAFETYFGLETIEARYAFCYASPANGTAEGISVTFNRYNSTPLHSKAWFDCQYGYDPFECTENAAYQAANVYRNQLRNAMNESIANPYVAPNPIAAKTCEWEKFEGLNDSRAEAQVTIWLAGGFTIGAEVISSIPSENMCSQVTAPLSGITGKVSLAAYRCK